MIDEFIAVIYGICIVYGFLTIMFLTIWFMDWLAWRYGR